jgi:hypothetical protein
MGPSDYHEVKPENELDEQLALSWIKKLPNNKQKIAKEKYVSKKWKRGDFLNALLNP